MRPGRCYFSHCTPEKHVYDVISERKFYGVQAKDVDDGSGLRRTYEVVLVDGNKPLTPQTGLDCMIGNLAFAAKQGLDIEHKPCLLSVVGRGNPLDGAKFMQAAADGAGKYFAQLIESEKDVESDKNK